MTSKNKFDIYLRNKTIFEPLYLSVFSFLVTVIAKLKISAIKIIPNTSFLARLTTIIKLKIMLDTPAKLLQGLIPVVKVSVIRVYIFSGSIQSLGDAILAIKKIRFSANFKFREKMSSFSAKVSKIVFVLSPLYGVFNKLYTFDPQTLGDLDSLILGDMDVTVST